MAKTNTTLFRPVNRCIYCPAVENLSDEHIIPYALAGRIILPAASCERCAGITSAFEGRCASINYKSFRLREKLPTRRPKKRLKEVPMRYEWTEGRKEFMIPEAGTIATMPIIRFKPPGFLTNPRQKEVGIVGAGLSVMTDAPRELGHWKNCDAPTLTVTQGFDLVSHARLLAKIAHATAIGHLGFGSFEPWLPPYILGEDPCLSYLVGGTTQTEDPKPVDHEIKYEVFPQQNDEYLVTVTIRLFSLFGGPFNQVIVGRASKEMFDRRSSFEILR